MTELVKLTNEVLFFVEKCKSGSNFLSYISFGFGSSHYSTASSIEDDLGSKIFPELDQLLLHEDIHIRFSALKYLRCYVTLPEDQVPYQQIINSKIINRINPFLDLHVLPPFQFNSLWLLHNIMINTTFINDLPINDIISQLAKLLKHTSIPAISTLCVQCISAILKSDFLWIDTILNSDVINIISSFDTKWDDSTFQSAVLYFIQCFCECIPNFTSVRYLFDFLPLLSWLLDCNHGEITPTIQYATLRLLHTICSYFHTLDTIQLVLKHSIIPLLIQQLIKYPPTNLMIALEILLTLTQFGVPEELDVEFKPLIPILMFLIRQHIQEVKKGTRSLKSSDGSLTFHWSALSILERMCRHNDIMVPAFLAGNVYQTIALFITDPMFSKDTIASNLALSIIVFSVLHADERNLFFLCEENIMIVLAWELSLIAHYLHRHFRDEIRDAVFSNRGSTRKSTKKLDEKMLVDAVTQEVIDDIVMLVTRECEERTILVENIVSDMVNIFMDSKEDQVHSVEDDLFITDVTNQMVDGIIQTITEPPVEIVLTPTDITSEVQTMLNACELVMLSISKMIMKGQQMVASTAAYYNKYLRQLQTFADMPTILKTLVVPTSVVLVWNRISMVLKGHDFYEFNWYDVAGCVVNDAQLTLTKQDINHVMVSAGQIMPCFSFRSTAENSFWVITKLESDLAVVDDSAELGETEVAPISGDYEDEVVMQPIVDETPIVNEVQMPILRNRSEISNGNDSSVGFSKRYHASFNPNAVIVSCSSVDGFSRRSSILQPFSNDDSVSDSSFLFANIPEVDVEK